MTILLGSLLLLADPAATAQLPQAPAGVPASAPAKVAEKKICRVDTDDSSSRLRKRVCLTQTEWDHKEAGENTNDLKNIGAR